MANKDGLRGQTQARTVLAIKAFKGPGRLTIGEGLYFLVTTKGYRRWLFRYTFGGKQLELALGTEKELSLADARQCAARARQSLLQGIDPAETMSAAARRMEEKLKAGIPTFEEAARAYIDLVSPTFKNKKARQPWELSLLGYAKPIAKLPLNAISPNDIAKILNPIWNSKRETARRVRWRIEKVFGVAIVNGHRRRDPKDDIIQQLNPAAWKDNLEHLLASKSSKTAGRPKHCAALPYAEDPSFLADLSKRDAQAALALKFCILTATRTSEALSATWEEVDLPKGLWTIPASRMKAGREHVVPLNAPALELLKGLPRISGNPHLFPGQGRKAMSNMAMNMLLRRISPGDATVHGFRSSFRDWVSEETDFANDVAEAALAHAIVSKTERAYRRGDLLEKRKHLMSAWGEFCQAAGSS